MSSYTSSKTLPEFLKKRIEEVKNQTSIIQIGSNIDSVNISENLISLSAITFPCCLFNNNKY